MKRIIIGIIVAICLTLGLIKGGLGDSLFAGSGQKLTIEKTPVSEVNPNIIALGDKHSQDNTIFSWPTILSLSGGVIGIVTFRRNTYA